MSFAYFHSKGVKNAKIRQKLATFWRSIDFPGGSELNCSAEGPLKGAKMTVMDILEFRDINRQDPYNEIWFIWAKYVREGNFGPPPPSYFGLSSEIKTS